MRALLLASVMALVCAGTANANLISYSETFSNGLTVSGTFTGTVNGNAITDISNATLFFNGVAITRPIYVERYTDNGFVDGGAYASFNNSQNNFLFIDSNFAAGDSTFDAYFYSVQNYGDYATSTISQTAYGNVNAVLFADVTPTNVPEPASLALLGLGAAGIVAARRRRAA